MKEKFIISGCYYNYKDHEFRKALDIVKVDAVASKVELIVIMMNPGASRPSKKGSRILKNLKSVREVNAHDEFVDAIPDKTQDKIMEFMNLADINYVRIFNISDLKEVKSSIFYRKLKTMSNFHSIFSPERKDDRLLLKDDLPCLLAWGCSRQKSFSLLKDDAKRWLRQRKTFGHHPTKDSSNYFYHPLVRKNHLPSGKTWVDLIYKRWVKVFSKTPNTSSRKIFNA